MKPKTEHSKEILRWAREKYVSAPENEKANWEYMFPELKESEDERIRKYILQACEECIEANDRGLELSMDTTKKLAAYLERQKEPLPVPDKFSGLKSLMLQYLQSAANRKDDTEIESDTDLWGRKILDYMWKHDETH